MGRRPFQNPTNGPGLFCSRCRIGCWIRQVRIPGHVKGCRPKCNG
jgi:hypothetical protein